MPTRLERKIEDMRRGVVSLNPTALAQPIREEPGFLPIDWFVVVLEREDYVECTRRDTAQTVALAKPYLLRQYTATRTVSGEAQEILASYDVDDQLYGVYLPNGAGVHYTSGITTHAIHWLDLNVDGRYWAKT